VTFLKMLDLFGSRWQKTRAETSPVEILTIFSFALLFIAVGVGSGLIGYFSRPRPEPPPVSKPTTSLKRVEWWTTTTLNSASPPGRNDSDPYEYYPIGGENPNDYPEDYSNPYDSGCDGYNGCVITGDGEIPYDYQNDSFDVWGDGR
jgi:hypothetical protein